MNRILRRNILAGLTALLFLVPAGSLGASETPAEVSEPPAETAAFTSLQEQEPADEPFSIIWFSDIQRYSERWPAIS